MDKQQKRTNQGKLRWLTSWQRREYLAGIKARYENGESLRALAETEGVTRQAIRYWLTKKLKIDLRDTGRPVGMKHTEETKQRMSDTHKARYLEKCSKQSSQS